MKAFPSGLQQTGERFEENPLHEGMDLRDYFAVKAMQSLIIVEGCESMQSQRRYIISKRSYKMADEMMEARNAK